MKKFNLILLFLVLLFISCKDDKNDPNCPACATIENLSRDNGQELLNKMYQEIEALSTSVACTDGSKWDTLPIGAKACGGPAGYIAYLPGVHGDDFKKKVAQFTAAQTAFNKKWSVVSDCLALGKPSLIECVDGKPKIVR